MHRFWTSTIKPILETVAPQRVLQIGAKHGSITENLSAYCRACGALLDVVDPAPTPELHEILTRYPAEARYHPLRSLSAIPSLQAAQLVLLDGDPNWFTVYNELQQLYLHAAKAGGAPPVILLNCVAWPYARRDMYTDPRWLDETNRHPYASRGILPDQSELADSGLNGQFANASHEGGPANGVLTALEDFRASHQVKTSLHVLPYFDGLGILVPETRKTPALQAVIEGIFSSETLLEISRSLEKEKILLRVELAALKLALAKRSAALARAADQLAAASDAPNNPVAPAGAHHPAAGASA